MENIKTMAWADWAPAIERTARNVAAVLVAVYTAGYVTGQFVHQLNDALSDLITSTGVFWLQRLGIDTIDLDEPMAPILAPVIQRQAPVSATIAPPSGINAIHLLAADGLSQRQIARTLGISRHRVKAVLA